MSRIEKIPVPVKSSKSPVVLPLQAFLNFVLSGRTSLSIDALIKNKMRRKEPNVFDEVDPVGRDSICEDVVGTLRRKVVDAGALCSGRGGDDDVSRLVW
ncbi:hypothetical protein QQ045_020529 [Rhodiola kirilowii]